MDYIVFTDESSITKSRFASLSAFSMPIEHCEKLSDEIGKVLKTASVRELKWNKVRSQKYYRCAQGVLEVLFQELKRCDLRVDTVIWDHHDSRHSIQGRDDLANYERMFFHLLLNLIQRRPKDSSWHIRPDARNGIDWDTVCQCLYYKGKIMSIKGLPETLFSSLASFNLKSFIPVDSAKENLVQVADLCAGLAVFSKEKYSEYSLWKAQNTNQLSLNFSLEDKPTPKFSNSELYRMQLLDSFNNNCKSRKLRVGLDTKKCLFSYNPSLPINFWHYEPQGDYDKAPVKLISPSL